MNIPCKDQSPDFFEVEEFDVIWPVIYDIEMQKSINKKFHAFPSSIVIWSYFNGTSHNRFPSKGSEGFGKSSYFMEIQVGEILEFDRIKLVVV